MYSWNDAGLNTVNESMSLADCYGLHAAQSALTLFRSVNWQNGSPEAGQYMQDHFPAMTQTFGDYLIAHKYLHSYLTKCSFYLFKKKVPVSEYFCNKDFKVLSLAILY